MFIFHKGFFVINDNVSGYNDISAQCSDLYLPAAVAAILQAESSR